jgi:hypothetical protein
LIQFNGKLSSWWTSIAIGVLTLIFIGVQSLLVNLNTRQLTKTKSSTPEQLAASRKRQLLSFGGGALVVIVAAFLVIPFIQNVLYKSNNPTTAPVSTACQRKPFRQDQAATLTKDGAIIVYERNGGLNCVDELYAFYSDGRITGDNGTQKIEKQVTPADVDHLITQINGYGWFTDNMYSTNHNPCEACFTYFTSVSYNGQEKTVQAVDGGTDAPSEYWLMTGELTVIVPPFGPAP